MRVYGCEQGFKRSSNSFGTRKRNYTIASVNGVNLSSPKTVKFCFEKPSPLWQGSPLAENRAEVLKSGIYVARCVAFTCLELMCLLRKNYCKERLLNLNSNDYQNDYNELEGSNLRVVNANVSLIFELHFA